MNTADVKRIIEATLLCAQQPMSVSELRRLFADEVDVGPDTVRALLDELRGQWQPRGVNLVALAGGWRFQTAPDIARYVERLHPEKPPRYSRAVLETLAIVAYRQPVTRGDIEEIRGVAVSAQIVKTLEERGWIEVIGHKDVIGRPALFATTRQFLDDLGLRSLQELPALDGDAPAVDALGQAVMALAPAEPTAVAVTEGEADGDGDAAVASATVDEPRTDASVAPAIVPDGTDPTAADAESAGPETAAAATELPAPPSPEPPAVVEPDRAPESPPTVRPAFRPATSSEDAPEP